MRTIPRVFNSLLAACCIVALTISAHAQTSLTTGDVPRTISYQGLLTNADGSAVHDGEYRITLSLYADPAGAMAIWQDTYSAPVTGGLFNLYLGSGSASLPEASTMNRPLWVGIQVDGAPLMYPLTPLSAAPYALNVPDRAITSDKLAGGAVTAEKVEMDYVAGIAINGTTVTSKGTVLNIEGSDDIALTYNDETHTLQLSKSKPAMNGDNEKEASMLAVADAVWSLNGDGWDVSGATPVTPASGDWIGTSSTSGETFVLKTNGETVMRYQPNGANTPNVLGGHVSNSITAASKGSVIAGGGENLDVNTIDNDAQYAVIGGGSGNTASANHAAIGGGYYNIVSGTFGTIGGGQQNSMDAAADKAVIGGGHENNAYGLTSTIGGGYDNTTYGNHSTIGGGYHNSTTELYSTVSGGRENDVFGEASFIGGGHANEIQSTSDYAAVVSGEENIIQSGSNYSAIAAGKRNVIHDENEYAFIGGGTKNHISGSYSVIGGGDSNRASNFYTTIGGGLQNTATGYSSTIAGGENHHISGTGDKSFIGGGQNHYITNAMSVIAGGRDDTASGYASAIGGGAWNETSGDYSTIAGGDSNIASGTHAFVGGGYDNNATGTYSTVGGGDSNIASGNYSTATGGYRNVASGSYSTTSGGGYHIVSGSYSTVSGGAGNGTTASYATIGGGEFNSAGSYATIGGGDSHIASGLNSTIAGGWDNTTSAPFSTVGGGDRNNASASRSTIAGGSNNAAGGTYSAVTGGDNLQTTGYAQTVAGFYNASRGALASRPTAAAVLLNNDPLFMIGNGGSGGPRSNAFEVSYNGHSVVYGTNGAANNPIKGATYTDNIIYAWGDINAAGGIVNDVAVTGVAHVANSGIYVITIAINDPVTGLPIPLGVNTPVAITATLVADPQDPFRCADIRVTPLGVPGPNQFTVYTMDAGDAGCQGEDSRFMFHVTGRP